MSISERLQMVIKMNGMTNASFADKIGVQRSSISHVLAGRNKPSIDFIQKILVTFPKVDADWLVTGKKVGRVIADDESDLVLSTERLEKEVVSDLFESSLVKDEDDPPYEGRGVKKSEVLRQENSDNVKTYRKISRVIVFYDDGTFQEVPSID